MIRRASVSDVNEVVRMGRLFAEASGYNCEYDPDATEEMIRALVDREDAICLIGDGGMLFGLTYPVFFSPETRMAQELFWWVDEDKRGSRIGIELIKEYEKEAREMGCNCISMLCLERLNPEKVSGLYERMGYELRERGFQKWL